MNLDKSLYRILEARVKNKEEERLIQIEDEDRIRPFVREDDRELTEGERRKFHAFWDKYEFMYKPEELTCKTYTNRTGIFDPRYIPFGFYTKTLRSLFHIEEYNNTFKNKNYVEKLLPNLRHSKALVRRIQNCFLDGEYKQITIEEAVSICREYFKKENEFVIKPLIGGEGSAVQFISSDVSDRELYKLFKNYSWDFIAQHLIRQHESLAAIHSASVQTIRVYSIHHRGKVEILSAVLRMGTSGERIDNMAAGGVGCILDENGACADFVFDHAGNYFSAHPGGFNPAGFKIRNFDKIKQLVKDTHIFIPQIWCLAWDFTLDRDGEPLFIEYNTRGDITIPQSAGRAYLGNLAEEVLDDALKKYYIEKANASYSYREYRDHIRIISYIGDKRHVKIPSHIGGKPVTSISARAFQYNPKIRSAVVPDTVKNIYSYAFLGCSRLEKVKLSSAMKGMPTGLCQKCPSLTRLYIPESVKKFPKKVCSDSKNVVFECVENSAAHKFAVSENIETKELTPSKKAEKKQKKNRKNKDTLS